MADQSVDEGTCAYPQGPNVKPAIMLVLFLTTVLFVMYRMLGEEAEVEGEQREVKKEVGGEMKKQ